MKQIDPKKAAQLERLGMGSLSGKSTISHSAITEISAIDQVKTKLNCHFFLQ